MTVLHGLQEYVLKGITFVIKLADLNRMVDGNPVQVANFNCLGQYHLDFPGTGQRAFTSERFYRREEGLVVSSGFEL
jgi:hypothetical protein